MFHASSAPSSQQPGGEPADIGHHNTYLALPPPPPSQGAVEMMLRAMPMVLMFITGVSIGAVALQRINSLEEWRTRQQRESFTLNDAAALKAELLAEMRIMRVETETSMERLRGFADESRRRIVALEDAAFGRNTDGNFPR